MFMTFNCKIANFFAILIFLVALINNVEARMLRYNSPFTESIQKQSNERLLATEQVLNEILHMMTVRDCINCFRVRFMVFFLILIFFLF